MKLLHKNSPPLSTSCSSSMFRKFRRIRVTAIVYACGSICGVLLFLNFNEEFKRLMQQEPHYASGTQHDHDQEHPESGSNVPRDAFEGVKNEGQKIYSDETSRHSIKLNESMIIKPNESLAKYWFMWRGTRYPTVGTSTKKLWAEENPNSDRIVEQLMYITEDDLPQPVSAPFSLNIGIVNSDSESNGNVIEDNSKVGQNNEEIKSKSNSPTKIIHKPIKVKTILLYYGIGMSWGSNVVSGKNVFVQQKCPVNACRLTGSRSQMKEADVVVFKDVFMVPKARRNPDQLWVMYMLECPLNTQNFNDKNVFNLTATYRHDSDIVTAYEKWVYYDENIKSIPQGKNYAAGKSKKVAWFVSNCVAKNNRLEYARELGKYIEVDIYGACGYHSCARANSKQCFDLLSKTYKFYLAFENSNCRDYISEKFFVNGLGNNILPIVMGAHPDDYRRAAPYKSYIHVDDFGSPKELAKFLQELDENDEAYNDYFKWKGTGEFVNTHFFCRLCTMVHYADRYKEALGSDAPGRFYKDFNDWWRGPNVCTRRSWRNQVDIFANKTSQEQEKMNTSRFPNPSLQIT